MRLQSSYCPTRWLLLLFTYCVSAFAAQAHPVAKDEPPFLTVRGVAANAVVLTAADLQKLPHQSVKVKDQGGEVTIYEGIPLGDVLKRAGLDFEANLHGRSLTKYLLVEAIDKYRIVFALPEIDPAFTDRVVLLATKHDGKPISTEEGPLRIIVPDEKRQARWVRQVRVLSIVDAVPPAERNKKP